MSVFSDLNGNEIKLDSSLQNIIQKIRHAVISEWDAIGTYDSIIQSTSDDIVKKTLKDIRDEEMLHASQLTSLLKYLDHDFAKKYDSGIKEFEISLNKK